MQNVLKLTFLVIALGLHGCEKKGPMEQTAYDATDGKSEKLLKDTGIKASNETKVKNAVNDVGVEVSNTATEAANKIAEQFGGDQSTYKYKNWRNGGENIKIFFKNMKIHFDNCSKGAKKQANKTHADVKKNLK
jgi:hypothetical protein